MTAHHGADPVVTVAMTLPQAQALAALAREGRAVLDLDPLFLPRRADRRAAREAVRILRQSIHTGAAT